MRSASVSRGKDAGVVVDLKASRPNLVIPATVFLVHPRVLADEITTRVGSRR